MSASGDTQSQYAGTVRCHLCDSPAVATMHRLLNDELVPCCRDHGDLALACGLYGHPLPVPSDGIAILLECQP